MIDGSVALVTMSDIDEDEFLYGDASTQAPSETPKRTIDELESESEYSSDDSDVEFILAPRPGSAPEVTKMDSGMSTGASRAGAGASEAQPEQSTSVEEKRTEEKPRVPGVDVDAVATYDGRPLTQVSLNEFEDKPWRKPGADVTDYFNYGFDEFTWTAYCSKQDHLRTTWAPQKVMQNMGMPPMFMPGMMGMMGMMPGMNPPPQRPL